MITDPISDMLTRLRNASKVRHAEVRLPYSKLKLAVAKTLSEEGYVGAVEKTGTGTLAELRIALKYDAGQGVIRSIVRISKPGQRTYAGYADLPRVLSDNGIAIVSTSQGVMSNKEARKRKLGGEVLCEVY
jgi:small subunit ribosomal protein S8